MVLVVNVGIVRVGMCERRVRVLVRMRLARLFARFVVVLVVLVMCVRVSVSQQNMPM